MKNLFSVDLIDEFRATLILNRGFVCTVDTADLERLGPHRWVAHEVWYDGRAHTVAATTLWSDGNAAAVSMERFLLGVTDPGVRVRHLNGDLLDNRRTNLTLRPDTGAPALNPYGQVSGN